MIQKYKILDNLDNEIDIVNTIEEANQFKSKFELQREKAFVKNINNTWVAYTFKNFFEARELVELLEAPPTLNRVGQQ